MTGLPRHLLLWLVSKLDKIVLCNSRKFCKAMIDYVVSLFSIPSDSILIQGSYSISMITISVFIAIFSSFMGLQVAVQAADALSTNRRKLMLLVGSIALGGGIWSMHFIGMLAFELCTQVDYGWVLTSASLIPGIAASWVALNHIVTKPKGAIPLITAGVLVGAGIGTMHYSGMAAMEMAPLLRYDLAIFALSIIVAVSLAILSLWIRFGLTKAFSRSFTELQLNMASALVMGCAIAGMHYTGMAAARFVRPPGFEFSNQPPETSMYLAFGVTVITLVIISLVLGLNLILRYRDISNRAIASEQRLSATMETAIDSIIVIDKNGAITSANKATEKLLGWAIEDLVKQNVNVLIPEHLRSDQKGLLQRYLQGDDTSLVGRSQEVQAVHKDGSLVEIRLALGHVSHSDSDFFVAFMSDIRDRLKMEKALRDNEARLRSLVTNIPGVVYRCKDDNDWGMMFVNDAVEKITGYSKEDFLLPNHKISFADLIHQEDLARVIQESGKNDVFNVEYRIKRKDGEIRWMLEFGTRIIDPVSKEVWLDGFIMDITERHQMVNELTIAKDKAEQAAASRATFLANMSHEIRTPMNAIIGFSEILLEEQLKPDQRRHLSTINNSAKSLLHLLNDVLDSAKLDKGKLELEKRSFSLIEEIDAVISTLWIQAKNKGLKLQTKIDSAILPFYKGAPERIRQVLTNIVNNAIKFTQEGEVVVSVKPVTNEHIEFVVKDTGIGMSEDQLSRIFEAFTQADESMSRRFGGTGLGTTISKQLVELMGGSISATSTKGEGSEFKFTLPLEPATSVKKQVQHKIELPRLKILVVDDISQNVELLEELLTRLGHDVIIARDGQQALIRMETCDDIDVVLMDVQMPVMDGLTAATQRRAFERANQLKRTPIIALTASVLEDDRLAAQKAGMEGFANKPIEIQSLLREIAKVTGIETAPGHVEQGFSKKQLENTKVYTDLGIDTHAALSLWGSFDKYEKQLNRFLDQHSKDFEYLYALVEQQNIEAVSTELHKLKGLTANLSLTRIAALLAELEHQIELRQSLQNSQQLTNQIATNVVQLHQYFSNQKSACDNLIKPASDFDQDTLASILKEIQIAVQANEFDEHNLTKLESLGLGPYQDEINQVTIAIDDFEFEQANTLIERILTSLQTMKGE